MDTKLISIYIPGDRHLSEIASIRRSTREALLVHKLFNDIPSESGVEVQSVFVSGVNIIRTVLITYTRNSKPLTASFSRDEFYDITKLP